MEMEKGSSAPKVQFVGWRKPPKGKDWESWVNKMCSVHQSTWKSAEIYEAIMSSKYEIERYDELIFELASKWRSETNTFVFPWGEATLTLEDMLVLGGLSSSGVSALSSLENDAESLKILVDLDLARRELTRSKSRNALQGKWMEKFMDCGNDLEHAAFLSLWLSRFVFPTSCSTLTIIKHALPVAARLSRGIKIALAPVVLAMLYRDLSILEKTLGFKQCDAQTGDITTGRINLCGLFHLVQIWVWERFPKLKPVLNYRCGNIPRLARWSNVKIFKGTNLKSAIDSAERDFLWCPYGLLVNHVGNYLEAFGQFTKASNLLGFDSCIERYQPERVARQFGLEQNIYDIVKLCPTFQSSIINEQQRCFTRSQVKKLKAENVVNCGPLGFPPRTEDIAESECECECECECGSESECDFDSDSDYDPVLEIGSTQSFPASFGSPDVAKEDGKNDDDQLVQQQRSNVIYVPFDGESIEAMDSIKESPHETKEGEVADTKHDEIQGTEVRTDLLGGERAFPQVEVATSCDRKSSTNERSKDSGFDLEARITRLENIVYAHIKAPEAAI